VLGLGLLIPCGAEGGVAAAIPNPRILLNPSGLQEAKASSAIENIVWSSRTCGTTKSSLAS